MDRNALCFCGSGKKQKRCHPDVEATSAFAELIQLYQDLHAHLASGKDLGWCGAGCAYCCSHVFSVTQVEFLYACYGWEKLYGNIDGLFQRCEEIATQCVQENPHFLSAVEENCPGSVEEFCETADKQAKLFEWMRIPCVFLDEETQMCKVYEYRPLVCRYHGQGVLKEKGMTELLVCEKLGYVPTEDLVDLLPLGEKIVKLALFRSSKFHVSMLDRIYPVFWYGALFSSGKDNYGYKSRVYRSMSKDAYGDELFQRCLKS